jgi:hypothetical protein
MLKGHIATLVLFMLLNADGFSQELQIDDLLGLEWEQVFLDKGDKDWQQNWFLDGKKATIKNGEDGMLFSAGPVERENASHAVLWTKESFYGDLKIEFDFTKIDKATKAVNILYIQATGKEEGPYVKDITEWSEMRVVPKMSTYFNNMNLWHVSYAAFSNGNEKDKKGYVRARRYPVLKGKSFKDTELGASYDDTGFFKDDITYHMTVIKKDDMLFIKVDGDEKLTIFNWDFSEHPRITEGRIGLRHMWTRSSRYANFSISQLE